jgi:hypothetical protein
MPEVVSESVQKLDEPATPLVACPASIGGGVVKSLSFLPGGKDEALNKGELTNGMLFLEGLNLERVQCSCHMQVALTRVPCLERRNDAVLDFRVSFKCSQFLLKGI